MWVKLFADKPGVVCMYLAINISVFFSGECAPTLAPWKAITEVTTRENLPHKHTNELEGHVIYDINDIVHFEDNDIVMRDSHKFDDNNKLDNSVDQFKTLNNFNGVKKIKLTQDIADNKLDNDLENDLKMDNGKVMKTDRDDGVCECQHGGGCVNGVCLCPLGYAGDKCEITLDLKVREIEIKFLILCV
jgi:hypothetical protein